MRDRYDSESRSREQSRLVRMVHLLEALEQRRIVMGTKSSVEQLNSFLRGEISAVETYQLALEKIDHISTLRDELLVNLKSHQDRVMMLQEAIRTLGGEPAEGSGPWGTFAKVVERGAKVLGEKAAVA